MPKHMGTTPYQTQELVKELADARRRKGLSQKDLAGRLGIPQSHVSNIERGKTDLRLSSFIDFARAVDLDVVLVPRKSLPALRSILAGPTSGSPPGDGSDEHLYRLGDAGDE
jgi:HTH-type transcriptional regulator/antitoxin HipB